ncbi:hypothetical protein ACIOVF_18310 [Pseudomonas sp. NPDC087612]|uniref:hypothetical protein n=1 Tax=unclassified Pseudomonas TaxID=196821 RepID=UPI00088DB400|nr:hypothetical protein [Pseudomonas sp. UC 17F4]SDQ49353.1 hypothetical protein SAMN05216487_2131 [Pseudomonas sp. UC 17F4]
MLRHAKHLFAQASIFALSKSAVLLAPFFAAWSLSTGEYGAVEWWLSVSMVVGPVLALGMHGVIAYGTLGGSLTQHLSSATAYVLVASTMAIVVSCSVFHLASQQWLIFATVIGLQSAIVVLQLAISARMKALGKGAVASLFESTVYLTLLVGLAAHWLGMDFLNVYVKIMTLCGGVMGGVLLWISPRPQRDALNVRAMKGALLQSYKFLIGGVLMAAFMGGPRILLGLLDDETAVATFSIVFRWLSIAIVVHQFINTVFFKRVYGGAVKYRSTAIMASVTLVGLAALIIAMALVFIPGEQLGLPWPLFEDRWLIATMALVMVFWAASASLEGVLGSAARPGLQTLSVAMGGTTFLAFTGIGVCLGVTDFKWLVSLAWIIGFLSIVLMQLRWVMKLGLFAFTRRNAVKVGSR